MIVIESGFTGIDYPLDHPRIGAHALTGTVTASSAAAGFDAAFAATLDSFSFWRPTALTATWDLAFTSAQVSGFCVFGHDMATRGNTLAAQTWTGSAWTTRISHAPTDNGPIFGLMPRRSLDRFRFSISGGTVPTLAGFMVFDVIEFPQRANYVGSEDFEFISQPEFRDTRADGGVVLERFLQRRALPAKMEITDLSEAFRDAKLGPLRDWMLTKPVVMADRPLSRPKSVVFGLGQEPLKFNRTRANAANSIGVTFDVSGHVPA